MKKRPLRNLLIAFAWMIFILPHTALAETAVSGYINTDTTWTTDGSPYILSGVVYVAHSERSGSTATLTIEAGVEVLFQPGAYLVIGRYSYGPYYGVLDVNGTEAQPVVFSSNADEPAPGDWKSVRFTNYTTANSTLDYAIFDHGGATYDGMVYCQASSPELTNCFFRDSASNGLYADSNARPVLSDCTFEDNAEGAAYVYPSAADGFTGCEGTGNGINGIRVYGSGMMESGVWHDQGLPFVLEGNVTVRYSDRSGTPATLTIEPGVEVLFQPGYGLTVGYYSSGDFMGALYAVGTEQKPITFTSYAETPSPGDWKGLYFSRSTDESSTALDYCNISYGGLTYNANIYILNCEPPVSNCTLTHSSAYGIRLADNVTPAIEDNVISYNQSSAIYTFPVGVGGMSGNAGVGNGRDAIEVAGGLLREDQTWKSQGLYYYIAGDLSVYYADRSGENALLTLGPGVNMAFASNAGLNTGYYSNGDYKGALHAVGTEGAPIKLYSAQDPAVPGDWDGVYFRNGTDSPNCRMEYCTVQHGGAGGAGIRMVDASPVISACTVISNTGMGVWCDDKSRPSLWNNLISDNEDEAVYMHPISVGYTSGNQGSGNGLDAVHVRGGKLEVDSTWVPQGLPYQIEGDLKVWAASSADPPVTFTVSAGCTLAFESGKYMQLGYRASYSVIYDACFQCLGTEEKPVTFTSAACNPAPGDWGGLYFTKGSLDESVLQHAVVEYAGSELWVGDSESGIYLYNSSPVIQYCDIRANKGAGIFSRGDDCNNALFQCNNLTENHQGIKLDYNAQPAIVNNNFVRNRDYGLIQLDDEGVDATNNYWNSAGGPGTGGDDVSGSVNATPYLTAPSSCKDMPPENLPPILPNRPAPADGETDVTMSGDAAEISFCAGDPNPEDSVTYRLYWGTDPESLAYADTVTLGVPHAQGGLVPGGTYYWQIWSQDAALELVKGPVWSFTTRNLPPTLGDVEVDGAHDGATITLDWSDYDPSVHGDVAGYRIYQHSSSFDTVASATLLDSVPVTQTTFEITGLTKGQTYWFAVVAVDSEGDFDENVTSVEGVPTDAIPPEAPTNLKVECLGDSLIYTFKPSADSAGDLAGYNAYWDGSASPDVLGTDVTSYTKTELAPATQYDFSLTAFDADGNESPVLSLPGVTLMANPAVITATAGTACVDFAWTPSQPESLVDHYNVYVETEDFDSVSGILPVMQASGASAVLCGLELKDTYYVAVTAVNLSGGENTVVDAVPFAIPAPVIVRVEASHDDPVPNTDDFSLSIIFNTTMDAGVSPTLNLSNTTGGTAPAVPAGGTWLTTTLANDTYQTGDFIFAAGNEGTISLSVSNAQDADGAVMDPAAGVFSFELDMTPPPAVSPVLDNVDCTRATLAWGDYVKAADHAGYNVYLSGSGDFASTDEASLISTRPGWASSYTIRGLDLDSTYYATICARDDAGNVSPVSATVLIETPPIIPPVVNATAAPGPDPDQVLLDWGGYEACSLSGFKVFQSSSTFSDVTGMSALASVGLNKGNEYTVSNVDRTATTYFAVVAYSKDGECNPNVMPIVWTDPFAGDIDSDKTIGAGAEKEVVIHQTMTVKSGATLTVAQGASLQFEAGAGLVVEDGALIAQGTALYPIIFTSAEENPAKGDWEGITLQQKAGDSNLTHVFINYGKGLTVDSCSPATEALTFYNNADHGLLAKGSAVVTAAKTLAAYSTAGLVVQDQADLTVNGSVIKRNATNAAGSSSVTLNAQTNYWGVSGEADIPGTLSGDVDYSSPLLSEPCLTPAIGTASGRTLISQDDVTLRLACRTAEEMRISEDSSFTGVYYQEFAQEAVHSLSTGGGAKTIYAQFRSITGDESEVVQVDLTYLTGGPVIESFNITEGQVITRPYTIAATVQSPLGMEEIELYIDGALVEESGTVTIDHTWDVRNYTGGVHTVTIEAVDNSGALLIEDRSVIVEPGPPLAPVLTSPEAGLILADTLVTVGGSAEPNIGIRIYVNSVFAGSTLSASSGDFSLSNVELAEGDNRIKAYAVDDTGTSPASNVILIVLDTVMPGAPQNLKAEVNAGSGIALEWEYSSAGEIPVAYNVYKLDSYFSDVSEATLHDQYVKTTQWYETNPGTAVWYYGVTALDSAGNESGLSNVVQAEYDAVPPALSITYVPEADAYGPGPVEVHLASDEELVGDPYLAFIPSSATSPIAPALTPVQGEPLSWTGVFTVTASMESGPVGVYTGARDEFGNTFKGIPSGPALILDTQGLTGTLACDQGFVISIAGSTDLDLTLTLSETPGEAPQLFFTSPLGAQTEIVLAGADAEYTGTLTVDASMGAGSGVFTFIAVDGVGNSVNTEPENSILELYNTAQPPAPEGVPWVTAESAPAGVINLEWGASSNAYTYRVYRGEGGCPGDAPTLAAQDIAGLTYADTPPADGTYRYVVAAERLGVETVITGCVEAVSDATPPGAPENVYAEVQTQGVAVAWDAPSAGETPSMYKIYQDGELAGKVLDGADLSFMGRPASGGTVAYTVSSVDAVGNETPAAAVEINLAVGLIHSLNALVYRDYYPQLTWECDDPNAVGYNVYRENALLTPEPLTQAQFTDEHFTLTSAALYSVAAVDDTGREGPRRSVTVHPVSMDVAFNPDDDGLNTYLTANSFNNVVVTITNHDSAEALDLDEVGIVLLLDDEEKAAVSMDGESIPPGENRSFVFCTPLGESLNERAVQVQAFVEYPDNGQVEYRGQNILDDIYWPSGMINLALQSSPVAGVTLNVQACLVNKGHDVMDVILARNGGLSAGDMYAAVRTADGLELARGYSVGYPSGAAAMPDGTLYYSLAPGTEVCVDIQVLVPSSVQEGDALLIFAGVEKVYHDLGLDTETSLGPVEDKTLASADVLPYYGTAQCDQDAYVDGAAVVISGYARDTATDEPVGNAPLKIGFSLWGYNWFEAVTTEADGSYSLSYVPSVGLSGRITVWAAHPSNEDALVHDYFTLQRMYCTSPNAEIRTTQARSLDFDVNLMNPGTFNMNLASASFEAFVEDAEGNRTAIDDLDFDFNFNPGEITVPARGYVNTPCTLHTGADAPDEAIAVLTFVSDMGATAVMTATVYCLPANPLIAVDSPEQGYLDLAMDRGDIKTRTVTFSNMGQETLEDAKVTPPENISWMQTNLPLGDDGAVELGDIAVGESRSFDVVLVPPDDTEFGYHNDVFTVTGSNSIQEFEIPVYVNITSALEGDVLFVVDDIVGQKVEGAKVRLYNNTIGVQLDIAETDENGQALISGVQEGMWSWQVSASGCSSETGVVEIIPEQTVQENCILSRSFVNINFSVEPVPFTDRYEIVLEQTFMTHVPMPVLVLDPSYKEYTNVVAGFSDTFSVEVSNVGLMAAQNLTIESFNVSWGSLVPLIEYVPVLGANQSMIIPYRMCYFGDEDDAGSSRKSSVNSADDPFPISKKGSRPSKSGWGELPDPDDGDWEDFLDCVLGGYQGLGKALKAMISRMMANGVCITSGGAVLAAATMFLTLKAMADVMQGPWDFIANVFSCLWQKIFKIKDTGSVPDAPPGVSGNGAWTYGGGPPCFAQGTPVLMADGKEKPIELVGAGDNVMGFDGKPDRVRRKTKRRSPSLREMWVEMEDGLVQRIVTTDAHLFYTRENGWTKAREVEVNDILSRPGNLPAVVTRNRAIDKEADVYSLDVTRNRSFFAGGVLVHERCGAGEGGAL
ncbi:Fibronectin type III domain protein [Desulfatibacillum aliphaticivorans]|uniref:Fibronectin type III domain protein n=1 Tax=Desulfatibacillum aliphaticivorans TaxID=218208 RepID=B8FA79_DESAL|nr:right-handed parallel beta-helix repeat-containing protein [Desulfatibacillum aliphaticivorans]ACL03175.1 Fibronectin type III domain protein [Desulfatibacillum aliphaticivorans]